MATNRIFAPQNNLTVAASLLTGPNDPVESGDAVIFGEGNIPCVALTDQDADDEVTVQFGQAFVVYDIPVVGADGAGNAAVAAGDLVYFDTDAINADDANGSAYGTALEAVASGATTTVRVAVGLTS